MAVEDSVAQDQLRAFIERIERMEEEKAAIAADIKEIYAEAKGNGFDVKILRKLVTIRKQDANERAEQEAILELYMGALGMIAAPDDDEPQPTRRQSYEHRAAPLDMGRAATITEPQSAPQAARDLADSQALNGQVAPTHVSLRKAAEAEGESPAQDDGAICEVMGNARRANAVSVEPPSSTLIRPETANDDRSCVSVLGGLTQSLQRQATREGEAARPLPPAYSNPGVVVVESCPPEGVVAHPYVACWPANLVDVADGIRKPIIKIGKLILDGRGRYFAARAVRLLDGSAMEYPVVQYDGSAPLADSIRWNLAARPNLHASSLRTIAAMLSKLEPERADEIMDLFGLAEVLEAAQ